MIFEQDFNEGVMLLVNKPLEWTSFDVVKKIRNTTKAKKVGHAGTLDPLATGLLILCTGKFTKQIQRYQGMDKEYTGTITLGATTPSFDLETEVDQRFPYEHLTEEAIVKATQSFTGIIDQVPPNYSANRVKGVRAYDKSRRGEDFVLEAKQVEVKSFEITRFALPEIDFRIVCSKGTYIRSIANDLGKALNNGGHLTALCRTKIGDYSLTDAWELPKLQEAIQEYHGKQQ